MKKICDGTIVRNNAKLLITTLKLRKNWTGVMFYKIRSTNYIFVYFDIVNLLYYRIANIILFSCVDDKIYINVFTTEASVWK